MSKKAVFSIIVLTICFALVSCSNAKAPAEAAIKAAEEALAGVKSDAAVYVPDQLKSVEDALASAKESFQKGEYQQALTGAKDLAARAKDLGTAVAAKKDELTQSWQEMGSGVPGMVRAIQSRVDILSKSRRLPAGLDKEKFESVKASLATVTQSWTDASNAFQGGNLMEAVNQGKAVKEKAVEIMNTLGMQVPEAAMK